MEVDPDAELMLRLKNGEDSILNELMTRWQQPLVAFIYRYIHHETMRSILLRKPLFVSMRSAVATRSGCKGKNSCKGKGGCATEGSKPSQT
jgi:hypothetical protein